MKTLFALLAAQVVLVGLACARPEPLEDSPSGADPAGDLEGPPSIVASNVFYYYVDVEQAWRFYTEVMGFETAADYGFAKILRIAETAYMTLVDEAQGMHSATDPKTVTLGLVTDEPEAWLAYLESSSVPIHSPLSDSETGAEVTFVAVDPEGYLLEFVRYNPHEENEVLLPTISETTNWTPMPGLATQRPASLGIRASVLWFYYRDPAAARSFYESALGLQLTADQDWAWIYQTSRSAFLGIVDGSLGLHEPTENKGVMASFLTHDIEGWWTWAQGVSDLALRSTEIGDESGRVRVFVGTDPENYFLEWDEFLPVPGNERLVPALPSASTGLQERSYRLGGIGAFAEAVGAGVKTMALSAAVLPHEMDELESEAQRIAAANGAQIYRERDFLVTDLFPLSVTEGRDVLVIYTGDTLERYMALKNRKADMVTTGAYDEPANRRLIAEEMGALLSYPSWKIEELLSQSSGQP